MAPNASRLCRYPADDGGSLRVSWVGDEFGKLLPQKGVTPPPVGTRLECTVPHCNPTASQRDVIHLARSDRQGALWPIEGRGLSD